MLPDLDMTYNVFGGTINLTQPSQHAEILKLNQDESTHILIVHVQLVAFCKHQDISRERGRKCKAKLVFMRLKQAKGSRHRQDWGQNISISRQALAGWANSMTSEKLSVCMLTRSAIIIYPLNVETCKPAYTELLMISDHKPKLGQSDLVYWVYRSS